MAKRKIEIKRPSIDADAIKKKIKRRKAPKGTQAPDFYGWLDDPDAGDPMGNMVPTDDLEADATAEVEVIGEALKKILEEKRQRREAYALLTDQSYYCTLVFQTTGQKLAFLEEKGWMDADNFQGMMFNGLEIADIEGVEIEPVYIPTKEPPKAPVKLREHPVIGE